MPVVPPKGRFKSHGAGEERLNHRPPEEANFTPASEADLSVRSATAVEQHGLGVGVLKQ